MNPWRLVSSSENTSIANRKEAGHSFWRKLLRFTLWLGLVVALFLTAIEVLARRNVNGEIARRAHLGNRLFVKTQGTGSPIVFIAGLEGSTSYWDNVFDPLTRDHRLIFVDALGFGRSPWPRKAPTIEDHLSAMRRTLIVLGATHHVTFVAHSFGTVLAAHYAAQYPEDVDRLVLLGTPIFDTPAVARQRMKAMSGFAALYALSPLAARESCLLMGSLRPFLTWLLPRVMSIPPDVARDAVMHNWPSIDGAIQNILMTQPITVPLSIIGKETVFVHGRADRVTPIAHVAEIARRAGARLFVTGNDHQGYLKEGRSAVLDAISGRTAQGGVVGHP